MKAMALPPGEIKIKRKRTDEPVDLLRIHEPLDKKLKRATEFIFFRQQVTPPTVTNAFQPTSVIRDLKSQSDTPNNEAERIPASNRLTKTNDSIPLDSALNSLIAIDRHFHISYPAIPSEVAQAAPQGVTNSRKRKADTIFMERKPSVRFKPSVTSSPTTSTENKISSIQKSQPLLPHAQKKPGLAARSLARTTHPSTPKPSYNKNFPPRSNKLLDVKSDELVAELQAYTISEIRSNILNSQQSSSSKFPGYVPSSRFIPKAPALRYRERNPEKIDIDTDIEIEYVPQKEEDDDDWVVDTFLRMPVTALDTIRTEDHKSSGFLILDSQAEIEEFYNDGTDSGEDDEDEDEDENAENHYTADYPDDEISSNDEYDLNAYHYSKDIDEFEADVLSDDEDDRSKYPWTLKPWLGGCKTADSDDTDEE